MRQTRIDRRRRPIRARRYADDPYAPAEVLDLDPRDPDIVRAKRLRLAARKETDGS
ncbi:hypothetical protein [Streptomyces sp. TRM68367]|uniref:hypothetical protein n=1 Tax=Streptomyces sp. TRM68367 TaxID=2758415 RepID=UPI00165C42A9|nr:hypothetical protein [Streptomyces sp. TRM68367]MBC9724693.1 hypothetical protein [Streptomyces sp. TRM68367]